MAEVAQQVSLQFGVVPARPINPVNNSASGTSNPRKAKSERKRPVCSCQASAYSTSVNSAQLPTRISFIALPQTKLAGGLWPRRRTQSRDFGYDLCKFCSRGRTLTKEIALSDTKSQHTNQHKAQKTDEKKDEGKAPKAHAGFSGPGTDNTSAGPGGGAATASARAVHPKESNGVSTPHGPGITPARVVTNPSVGPA